MPPRTASRIHGILASNDMAILADWLENLRSRVDDRVSTAELETQCKAFLFQFTNALRQDAAIDVEGAAFESVRELLTEISHLRATQGFSTAESTAFVFSFKRPLFDQLSAALGEDAQGLVREIAMANEILDFFVVHMMEQFQRRREEVIVRQQQEIAELSTPVVKLWQGVLALPLIGTLDSSRTQVVMENLLESIVRYEADIAIIDITGVPTVDTLVAQHLLKTVAAARLMGADCIISGIRPQIAQTMVHLGVELNVVSKATLADAFALALRRLGRSVVAVRQSADRGLDHAQ